jgi:hypothetical protein
MATCFLPAGCNVPLIDGFFRQYLINSEKLMASQVKGFLQPFKATCSSVSGDMEGIKNEVTSFSQSVTDTQTQIKRIIDDVCKNGTVCTDDAFKRFQSKGITRV